MKKAEIVNYLLKRKILLSPDALDFLYRNQNEIEKAIEIASHGTKYITLDLLLKSRNTESEKLLIEKIETENNVSVDKIRSCLEQRFNFLSKILAKKRELKNLISINKIRHAHNFSLIGLVKEKECDSLVIEDKTGHVNIRVSEKEASQVYIDEVIGIVCQQEDNILFSEKIVKPDIPVFRKIPTTNKRISVTLKGIRMEDSFLEINWDEIARINIENFFIIFLRDRILEKYGSISKETVINLLKGRNLHPTIKFRSKFYKKDPFLLDKIPDLIIIPNESLDTFNYKGTTIIFLPNDYGIDLSQRKPIKLEQK